MLEIKIKLSETSLLSLMRALDRVEKINERLAHVDYYAALELFEEKAVVNQNIVTLVGPGIRKYVESQSPPDED